MQSEMRKIMWLASYPKSGNTWMRAFMANYLLQRPQGDPLPLDEMTRITIGDSSAESISAHAGRPHEELSPQDIYTARYHYLAEIASIATPTFVKTHMPYASMFGVPIVPLELSRCAIYIARNPLDMVISYADHMGFDFERAAEAIANRGNLLGANENHITQLVGNWSLHVRSWQSLKGIPVALLRYEDLIADPVRGFTAAVQCIGAPLDPARLADAIEASSFGRLQQQEAAEGFVERSNHQQRFFRAGGAGQWKSVLPQPVVDRIVADHGEVMRDLGYL